MPYEDVFTWPFPAENVLVTGDFDDWNKTIFCIPYGDGFEGAATVPYDTDIRFKFIVDGQWRYRDDLPTAADERGNINNIYRSRTRSDVSEAARRPSPASSPVASRKSSDASLTPPPSEYHSASGEEQEEHELERRSYATALSGDFESYFAHPFSESSSAFSSPSTAQSSLLFGPHTPTSPYALSTPPAIKMDSDEDVFDISGPVWDPIAYIPRAAKKPRKTPTASPLSTNDSILPPLPPIDGATAAVHSTTDASDVSETDVHHEGARGIVVPASITNEDESSLTGRAVAGASALASWIWSGRSNPASPNADPSTLPPASSRPSTPKLKANVTSWPSRADDGVPETWLDERPHRRERTRSFASSRAAREGAHAAVPASKPKKAETKEEVTVTVPPVPKLDAGALAQAFSSSKTSKDSLVDIVPFHDSDVAHLETAPVLREEATAKAVPSSSTPTQPTASRSPLMFPLVPFKSSSGEETRTVAPVEEQKKAQEGEKVDASSFVVPAVATEEPHAPESKAVSPPSPVVAPASLPTLPTAEEPTASSAVVEEVPVVLREPPVAPSIPTAEPSETGKASTGIESEQKESVQVPAEASSPVPVAVVESSQNESTDPITTPIELPTSEPSSSTTKVDHSRSPSTGGVAFVSSPSSPTKESTGALPRTSESSSPRSTRASGKYGDLVNVDPRRHSRLRKSSHGIDVTSPISPGSSISGDEYPRRRKDSFFKRVKREARHIKDEVVEFFHHEHEHDQHHAEKSAHPVSPPSSPSSSKRSPITPSASPKTSRRSRLFSSSESKEESSRKASHQGHHTHLDIFARAE